jgi:HSP20 family protein
MSDGSSKQTKTLAALVALILAAAAVVQSYYMVKMHGRIATTFAATNDGTDAGVKSLAVNSDSAQTVRHPLQIGTDISENDAQYSVRMEIPGADGSKVNATLKDCTLTVSGTREKMATSVSGPERRAGQFERSITFTGPVKQDGMQTHYENGVLRITIPKDPPPPQQKGTNPIPIQ